ncbi:MAG: HD-GYP domain-containing protein [Bacillota bacterium]
MRFSTLKENVSRALAKLIEVPPDDFRQWEKRTGLEIPAVYGLMVTIRAHHRETFKHSIEVARLSARLALRLRMDQEEVMNIGVGALLHDLGKTTINPTLLNKPEKLSRKEWAFMRAHTTHGVNMLKSYLWSDSLLPVVAQHHERWDGSGYHGKAGEGIPLPARIVGLADAYEAMTSPRPYQPARTHEESWEEIRRCSGAQFDPALLEDFHKVTSDLIEPRIIANPYGISPAISSSR